MAAAQTSLNAEKAKDEGLDMLFNSKLSVSQISVLKDALEKGIKIEYFKLVAKPDFKFSSMCVLLEIAFEIEDLGIFTHLANPKLAVYKISYLADLIKNNKLSEEYVKVLSNPKFSVVQLGVLEEAIKKEVSFDYIKRAADPAINATKMAVLLGTK
ncbi:hypothetical protein [Spiroplasma endosymbiont of Othius punctulatus]|uniref:hypothetical protein n=1 Tax=Spiroplasma endosymbiont of Othius punctulatus TaxID=3066289 RepID=UPI0030CBDFF5